GQAPGLALQAKGSNTDLAFFEPSLSTKNSVRVSFPFRSNSPAIPFAAEPFRFVRLALLRLRDRNKDKSRCRLPGREGCAMQLPARPKPFLRAEAVRTLHRLKETPQQSTADTTPEARIV